MEADFTTLFVEKHGKNMVAIPLPRKRPGPKCGSCLQQNLHIQHNPTIDQESSDGDLNSIV